MRTFELKSRLGGLPEKAGEAIIEWKTFSKNTDRPFRIKSRICLPESPDTQFFPLLGGQQFLAEVVVEGRKRLYFGGTDEQPFFVEMDIGVLTALENGEQGFYDAIKPQMIKHLEGSFGTKALRQGDWFGVPFPKHISWNDASGLLAALYGRLPLKSGKVTDKGYALHNTRHQLFNGRVLEDHNILLGEGVLKAPDHSDKEFIGPHLFYQTEKLTDPQKAD